VSGLARMRRMVPIHEMTGHSKEQADAW
jgi:hypothetical protein